MRKNNKKGFTLAELLIVVAIIAVLTAIAIPVFTGQLDKSKASADAANIRACYAEAMAESLMNDGATASSKTTFKAQTDGSKFTTYKIELPQNGSTISMKVGDQYKVTYTGATTDEDGNVTNGSWAVVAASSTPSGGGD